MRSCRLSIAGLFVILGLASCAPDNDRASSEAADGPVAAQSGTPSVLVTTSIWADVVENVGCTAVGPLTPLIPPGADPHGFRPTIAGAEAMGSASLIVANGGGLEEPLEELLTQAEAEGTPVLYLTDHVGDGSDDPHLWLDPTVVISAVAAIEQALLESGLEPEVVEPCARSYVSELESLDQELASLVEPLDQGQRKLITNHDALGRFADRYGFEVLGTVLPSTSSLAQATPANLDELADKIADEEVAAIFTEGGHHGEDAHALADRAGVSAVALQTDSLGSEGSEFETYADLMRTNTALIVAALSGADVDDEHAAVAARVRSV